MLGVGYKVGSEVYNNLLESPLHLLTLLHIKYYIMFFIILQLTILRKDVQRTQKHVRHWFYLRIVENSSCIEFPLLAFRHL